MTGSEEESEHAVNGLLAVGFSPADGTKMVQVLWAGGSNTWGHLSAMQLQEDFQERLDPHSGKKQVSVSVGMQERQTLPSL